MKKIFFIILNYNNYSDTKSCIESITKNRDKRFSIIIVDNKSSDGSGVKLKKEYPQYTHIFCEINGGYAAGNNAGIKYAIEQGADYICLINNDAIIPDYFVERALKVLEQREDCEIISPVVCDYEKREYVQSAGSKMSLIKAVGPGLHQGELADEVSLDGDKPDYLSGACFIVRKEAFLKNGLLPEFYFLYYEETDWFFSARKKGIVFACDTRLRCYHKESATVNRVKGIQNRYSTRNMVIFERRHANYYQFIIFFIYSISRWIYHFIKSKKVIFPLKPFWEGLFFDWKERIK